MSANSNIDKSQYLQDETRQVVDAFEKLNADAKLALLYFVYKKMGSSITPAAPAATEPNLAPLLMGDYYELSDEDQLVIMRQIVNREDSPYSRAYGALKENNQLMVWFAWAQAMGKTVIDMPGNYPMSDTIGSLLGQIETLGFEHQISMLREIASNMGHTDVQAIPSQAETGKTSSL